MSAAIGFQPHPIANLFPMLPEQELAELAEDIRENGLLEPVVLHEGKILDGRNRNAACERAGVPIRVVEWAGQGGSPLRFVLSHNLHRRHLTIAQKAALAVELIPLFEEEARKNLADAGRKSAPGKPAEKGLPNSAKVTHSRVEAAKALDVGHSTVGRAKQIKESDPETFEKMKAGEFRSVEAAHRAAGLAGSDSGRSAKSKETETARPTSERDKMRAEAHKRRLVSVLSSVSGSCRVLKDIDMRLAVAALTAEEVSTWADTAQDCVRQLRALRTTLNGIESHE